MTSIAIRASALNFQNTNFDLIDHNGDVWLRSPQIAEALGYRQTNRVVDLYARHQDEFTDSMTAVVKLTTPGGEQDTRIFSPRGCYALAMFARTKVAKAFRVWVLDVLESVRKTGQYTAAPYTAGPHDSLTAEQAETLRDMIRSTADKLPKEKQGEFIRRGWSKLMSHFKVSYRKIPQAEFVEAVSIVARHCVQHGELIEAEQKPAITEQHILDAARAELTRPGRRFLVAFNTDGGEDLIKMMSVPTDAMLASWRSIPEMIRSPGNRPSTAEVTEIISACANLLSSRNALIQ